MKITSLNNYLLYISVDKITVKKWKITDYYQNVQLQGLNAALKKKKLKHRMLLIIFDNLLAFKNKNTNFEPEIFFTIFNERYI